MWTTPRVTKSRENQSSGGPTLACVLPLGSLPGSHSEYWRSMLAEKKEPF